MLRHKKHDRKPVTDGPTDRRTDALWAEMCAGLRIEDLLNILSCCIAHKDTYTVNNIFLHIFIYSMLFIPNIDSFPLDLKPYKL